MPKIKKLDEFLEKPVMRIVLTVVSALLSTTVLAISTITIINVAQHSYVAAPYFLIWTFIALGLLAFVTYLKERTKVNFIRFIVLFIFDIALGVISLFAKDNPYLFSLTTGLYCLTIVVSRIFRLIQRHRARDIVLNALIIVAMFFMGIALLTPVEEDMVQSIIVLECVFIAIVSFLEAASIAFRQLKVKVLFKIIVRTYSLEVLFGLFTMIVCFSLVFMMTEPDINNFPDALWYCFAVVTTIGFGDFTAVTPIGRILTVLLGIYGLIVVAVITSIIVNFYNETSSKHDNKELKDIKKEEEKK